MVTHSFGEPIVIFIKKGHTFQKENTLSKTFNRGYSASMSSFITRNFSRRCFQKRVKSYFWLTGSTILDRKLSIWPETCSYNFLYVSKISINFKKAKKRLLATGRTTLDRNFFARNIFYRFSNESFYKQLTKQYFPQQNALKTTLEIKTPP